MQDVKVCLKELKDIYKSERKNKENVRYSKVYEKIANCSAQERDNLEILLRCEMESTKRLDTFKGILPIFLSVISLVVSLSNKYTIVPMQTVMGVMVLVGGLTLLIYLFLSNVSGRSLDNCTYLDGVLQNVKRDKSKR